MQIKLSGDFAALQKFINRLSNPARVLEVAAQNMAEEGLTLVAEGFRAERDPYGKAWKPLALRRGKILQDTGRMRSSWHHKRVTKHGFTIAPSANYAQYHQRGVGPIRPRRAKALKFRVGGKTVFAKGTKGIPQRRMVPGRGPLPPLWRKSLTTAAREAFELFDR